MDASDQRDATEERANQAALEREGQEELLAEAAEGLKQIALEEQLKQIEADEKKLLDDVLGRAEEEWDAQRDAYAHVVTSDKVLCAKWYEITVKDRAKVRKDLLALGYNFSDLLREAMEYADEGEEFHLVRFHLVKSKPCSNSSDECACSAAPPYWAIEESTAYLSEHTDLIYGPVYVSGTYSEGHK